ncbi:hypothetical protein MM236_15830 [Belliella sp. DSM 107340]|uniref:Uncharacterized protein n=1 Tax=Belliella calami TaxID=2923436 RepID=A0ABS9UT93_9BACT|nr:hypothetical protein [Belliella calami]MCH7399473.1 hypothetical protein [Belliella calami]
MKKNKRIYYFLIFTGLLYNFILFAKKESEIEKNKLENITIDSTSIQSTDTIFNKL